VEKKTTIKQPSSTRRLLEPMIQLLSDLAHYSRLYSIQVANLTVYNEYMERTIQSANYIAKSKAKIDIEKQFLEDELRLVKQEIKSGYYTIHSTELILGYSRLESAIDELIRLFFKTEDYSKFPDIDPVKINPIDFARKSKQFQRDYLAEHYISQASAGQLYGFQRFEAILSPIFGKSNLKEDSRKLIVMLSQIRNICVHKNGIIDSRCQKLLGLSEKAKNKRIVLSELLMESLMNSLLEYCVDINDRIIAHKKLAT
jgi:hypothetical protein